MKTFHKIVAQAKKLNLKGNLRFVFVKQELWKATKQYYNL